MPVILLNPGSGPKSTTVEDLQEVFGDRAEVRPTKGPRLAADVTRLADGGEPFVGVAGGDGSLRTAAPILAEAGVALLPVPCGTKNHFALAVGVESCEDAAAAAAPEGVERRVDLAWVGDECFLNTASIGMYAAVVRERSERQGKLPKRVADAIGVARQVVGGHRVRAVVGAEPVSAWVVFVGNGAYGESLVDLGQRERLDGGVLDVRVVRADSRLARLRLLGALVGGRLHRSPVVDRQVVAALDLDVRGRPSVDVALDGDVERLPTPLRWRVDAQGLRVRVPSPATVLGRPEGD